MIDPSIVWEVLTGGSGEGPAGGAETPYSFKASDVGTWYWSPIGGFDPLIPGWYVIVSVAASPGSGGSISVSSGSA